jgi:hypothetical protein
VLLLSECPQHGKERSVCLASLSPLQTTPIAAAMVGMVLAALRWIECNRQNKQQAELVCHGMWQPATAVAQAKPAQQKNPGCEATEQTSPPISHLFLFEPAALRSPSTFCSVWDQPATVA